MLDIRTNTTIMPKLETLVIIKLPLLNNEIRTLQTTTTTTRTTLRLIINLVILTERKTALRTRTDVMTNMIMNASSKLASIDIQTTTKLGDENELAITTAITENPAKESHEIVHDNIITAHAATTIHDSMSLVNDNADTVRVKRSDTLPILGIETLLNNRVTVLLDTDNLVLDYHVAIDSDDVINTATLDDDISIDSITNIVIDNLANRANGLTATHLTKHQPDHDISPPNKT